MHHRAAIIWHHVALFNTSDNDKWNVYRWNNQDMPSILGNYGGTRHFRLMSWSCQYILNGKIQGDQVSTFGWHHYIKGFNVGSLSRWWQLKHSPNSVVTLGVLTVVVKAGVARSRWRTGLCAEFIAIFAVSCLHVRFVCEFFVVFGVAAPTPAGFVCKFS